METQLYILKTNFNNERKKYINILDNNLWITKGLYIYYKTLNISINDLFLLNLSHILGRYLLKYKFTNIKTLLPVFSRYISDHYKPLFHPQKCIYLYRLYSIIITGIINNDNYYNPTIICYLKPLLSISTILYNNSWN